MELYKDYRIFILTIVLEKKQKENIQFKISNFLVRGIVLKNARVDGL